MNDELIFVDVNVPMYAAGKDHPYKQPCIDLLSSIANGEIQAAIDVEIVQEILYRFGALQLWQTGADMASSLLALIPTVLPVTPNDALLAVSLFAEHGPAGVKARDVLHVAVMQNNGIKQIISTDRHFDRIPAVTRLDPLEVQLG